MKNKKFLDLTRGISGDMFVAACYSFMDEKQQGLFAGSAQKACADLGGRADIVDVTHNDLSGIRVDWKLKDLSPVSNERDAFESLNSIGNSLKISNESRTFAQKVFEYLIEAEMNAHCVKREELHLHEVARPAALTNIATAGLCIDILELRRYAVIASYISIGEGEVDTAHGRMTIPTPATAHLLLNLRFRFGPFRGEMATPVGVAIARNVIDSQTDLLPGAGREGIGFGSRIFEEERGYVRLFEAREKTEAL